jgi:hypothetical protein
VYARVTSEVCSVKDVLIIITTLLMDVDVSIISFVAFINRGCSLPQQSHGCTNDIFFSQNVPSATD